MPQQMNDDDPYWQRLVPVGEIAFSPRDVQQLHLQVHTSDERYSDEWDRELGVELSAPHGVRQYVHARPCLLVPRIVLAAAVGEPPEFTGPSSSGGLGEVIGEVIGSEVQGMERHVIGNAQGWFYPSDRILVLWECEIFHRFGARRGEPKEDHILTTMWGAFERVLLEEFRDACKIVTPGWEAGYTDEQWQTFLRAQGYLPEEGHPRSFAKQVGGIADRC